MVTPQDGASAAALKEYALALAHPTTGIPCQVRLQTVRVANDWFTPSQIKFSPYSLGICRKCLGCVSSLDPQQ